MWRGTGEGRSLFFWRRRQAQGMRRAAARTFGPMRLVPPTFAALAFVGLIALAASFPAGACGAHRGQRVELSSQTLDPDVFVWDSPQLLAEYARGSSDVRYNAEAVLAHTILATAGTRAWVLACQKLDPSASLPGDPDILSVRVSAGPYRGRTGWVVSSDARRLDGRPLGSRER